MASLTSTTHASGETVAIHPTGWVKQIRRSPHEPRFLPFCMPDIGDAELAECAESLRAGWLTAGPKTRQLENEFGRFFGLRYSIAVQNGTTAFRLVLQSLGLRTGDEVLLSPFAPIAVVELVRAFGALPRLVDVTEDGLHMAPGEVERAINSRTRILIVSHTAGLPANMDELLAIAHRNGIRVIEDAGPAVAATYRHDRVGSLGDVACFSFYSQRALSMSDGGMICTNNLAVAQHCREMSQSPWGEVAVPMDSVPTVNSEFEPMPNFGEVNDSQLASGVAVASKAGHRVKIPGLPKSIRQAQQLASPHDGYLSAMNEINAAIGISQLRRAELMCQRRRQIALTYTIHFSRSPELQCPCDRTDSQHAWQAYWLRLDLRRLRISRQEFIEELRSQGIGAEVPAAPLHWQSLYSDLYGYRAESCPVATHEYARLIALPIYSRMTEADVQRVIDAVDSVVQRFRALPRQPR